jgi:hypothetical protein
VLLVSQRTHELITSHLNARCVSACCCDPSLSPSQRQAVWALRDDESECIRRIHAVHAYRRINTVHACCGHHINSRDSKQAGFSGPAICMRMSLGAVAAACRCLPAMPSHHKFQGNMHLCRDCPRVWVTQLLAPCWWGPLLSQFQMSRY